MADTAVLYICVLICCGTASASFGTSFAVSFPPTRSDSTNGYCKMYIHADIDTIASNALTILTGNSDDTYTLFPNDTRTVSFDPSNLRTSEGIEFKGIYVESTVNVSVILSNAGDGAIMDTALALPFNNGSNKYMILSHASSADEWICSVGSTVSFYTVTAYEDETTFQVYSNGGSVFVESVTLRRFQSYTNKTVKDGGQQQMNELTGYIIESDKPVSVTAGNPCADIDPIKSSGPVWSSMPATQNAGHTFVSHILEYPNAVLSPYLLRAVSLDDGNTVDMAAAEMSVVLNAGQYYDLIVENNKETEYITCSKQCMVAQHSIHHDTTAIFMVILPPMDHYISDVFFTLPDISGATVSSFLSIVYNTDDPYSSGLFLDGTDLSGELWLVHPLGYSFLELPIPDFVNEVVHRLTSEDPAKTFSALIHGQGAIGQGYGYIAGAVVNTSIIIPGPDQNETIPDEDFIYRISMNGNFVSSDGEEFTPECTVQYSIEILNQAEAMLTVVNDLIGIDLCPSLTTDVVFLQTVSTSLVTDGSQGNTFLQYDILASVGEYGPPDIESCATEIDNFLMTHSNWDDPLLPPAPGCPGVVFTSPRFNDSGSEWICPTVRQHHLHDQSSAKKDKMMVGTMIFTIVHTGNYFAENEENIPPECLAEHNSMFIQKTTDQVASVNNMISSREMCAAREADNVQLILGSVILSGTAGSGFSYQEYEMGYDPGTPSSDLYTCGSEVSAYLTQHSNWDQPMLPPIDNCPVLLFEPEEFLEYQLGWECVDV